MEEKKVLDSLQKIAAITLGFSSFLVICVPAIGFIYDLGYISTFGLDANLFPRVLSDLWQHSLRVSLELGIALLKQLKPVLPFIAYAFLAIIIVFEFIAILGNKDKIRAFIQKDFKFPFIDDMKLTLALLNKIYLNPKYLLYLFLGIVLFVCLFYLLMKPGQIGVMHARHIMDKYKESGCVSEKWSYCVDYSSPNNPTAKSYSGLLVAASSTHIAIFDGKSVNVIPRSTGYVLTRTYKDKDDESHR
jgi:hypothetical protein